MIDRDEAERAGFKTGDTGAAAAERKQAKLEQLQSILPRLVNGDGLLDTDVLKDELGIDRYAPPNQGYSLNFAGKGLAIIKADEPTAMELRTEREQSKDFDTAGNIIIRGDNLDALKILQRNYEGKIKMIYIDPPYNTDSDNFVYKDKFKVSEKELIEKHGLDENAVSFFENVLGTKNHSGWLFAMYPRLKLARELLTEDGVIFISIDDTEYANLKVMCDELFGEGNFAEKISWRRRHNQPNDATKMVGIVCENILCYHKDTQSYVATGVGKIGITGNFRNPDNDPRGEWSTTPWKSSAGQGGSVYSITTPSGRAYQEEWLGDESTYQRLLKDERIVFPRGGEGLPRKKYFKAEREKEGQCATNWWGHEQFGSNQEASAELEKLMGSKNVFSNPKPTRLIKALLTIGYVRSDDIVLDFFAGSGTTAQAVMEINMENGGGRRFILVQRDEQINPAEGKSARDFCKQSKIPAVISSICIERVNRAGEKIKDEAGLLENGLDIGYKVFSLAEKPKAEEGDGKQMQLTSQRQSAEDALYCMMAACGEVMLTDAIEVIEADKVYRVRESYFVLGECKTNLRELSGSRVYIDGYADISLLRWIEALGVDKDLVKILY